MAYAGTTPELIELVEKEVGDILPRETEMASYRDPSVLAEVRDAGYVTAPLATRLVSMHMTTVSERAGAILDLCSPVGEVADTAQDIARYTGIPVVRVDEEMCRETVRQGERIRVMTTLPTTPDPTKNTILRIARGMDRQMELVDVPVDDDSGLDQEQFKDLMSEYTGIIADKVDAIFFTQGSVAYYEEYIHEKYGKVVLSNPGFGAAVLKDALAKKGLMQ